MVRFHAEAETEFKNAAVFYEMQSPGLGFRFEHEVESTIKRIVETPNSWGFIESRIQRCLTPGFPYAIVFIAKADEILILAVVHLKRKPGYWQNRLANDN